MRDTTSPGMLALPGERKRNRSASAMPLSTKVLLSVIALILGGGGSGMAFFAKRNPDDDKAVIDKLTAEVEAAREKRLQSIETTLGEVVKAERRQDILLMKIGAKLQVKDLEAEEP